MTSVRYRLNKYKPRSKAKCIGPLVLIYATFVVLNATSVFINAIVVYKCHVCGFLTSYLC